jgi:SNF family Na+-dependent transporter
MGTAITMSSYTAPKEDTFRVCLFVALANSAFSLTGGFAIFSILGNLAKRTGRTVAEIAGANGPGLAFVSIADGVVTFGAGANAMAVPLLLAIQILTTHYSLLTTHYSLLAT